VTPTPVVVDIHERENRALDALRRVRPSFDRFYATLNDGQRKQVDKLFENAPL